MTEDEYVEIQIKILEETHQRVRVKRSLTIARLIEEILKEFEGMENSNPQMYAITARGSEKPFSDQTTLARLDIRSQDELEFRYARLSSRRLLKPEQYFYLKDENGLMHEVTWYPAVIGRPTAALDENNLLAVNLQSTRDGQKISRRHAQITFVDGLFYLEALSAENPTYLNNDPNPISSVKTISNGDQIYLGKPRIKLAFFTSMSGSPYKIIQNDNNLEIPGSNVVEAGATIMDNSNPQARITFIVNDLGKLGPIVVSKFPYELGREMVELKVGDTAVSRKHARIDYDVLAGQFTITDLNSRNGVLINGERIPADRPVPIFSGVVVNLGPKTQFRFDVIG